MFLKIPPGAEQITRRLDASAQGTCAAEAQTPTPGRPSLLSRRVPDRHDSPGRPPPTPSSNRGGRLIDPPGDVSRIAVAVAALPTRPLVLSERPAIRRREAIYPGRLAPDATGPQPPPSALLRRESSGISVAILRTLSDVKTSRARPPEGQNASRLNTVAPGVPHFPNLQRGSAKADGDCFFHSVTHLARPLIASHAGVREDQLTPATVRQHIASDMITRFNELNLGVTEGNELFAAAVDHDLPAHREPVSLDRARAVLAPHLHSQLAGLTPAQLTHVADIAENLAFREGSADSIPLLMSHAFPGLRVAVHGPAVTPQLLENQFSFLHQPHGRADGSAPEQTVRVYLAGQHFEPVFEAPARHGSRPAPASGA